MSAGENYPVIEPEEGDEGPYTVDHVVVVRPGERYKQEDKVVDDKGNEYTKFIDEQGRILNVIPPNPETNNLEPYTTLPELEVITSTGSGALLKAQLSPRPDYQGEVRQVIDCITPRDAGIVGFINGEPYYGAFHVMSNGVKMTGASHSGNDAIIYDTPQESFRSARTVGTAMTMTSTTTTTPVQRIGDSGMSDTSTGSSYTPPPSSPPSGGGGY